MSKRKKCFKWFGNLSLLQRSEKSNNKSASQKKGSLCGDTGAALMEKQSVDDMDSCFRHPSFASSSLMYTYVGTAPRSEKQKSCKGMKEKTEEKEEGMSSKGVEHVRDSPLLGALSSLSLTAMERSQAVSARLLPLIPNRASPLTSTPDSCLKDPSDAPVTSQEDLRSKPAPETGAEPLNMGSCKAVSKHDIYVPMDRISERTCSLSELQTERLGGEQETTGKTANNSQEVETDRCPGVTESSGEYVKFCKEKFWFEPPSEKLRKQLEEELKLSGTNLKSHAWYHGRIPWEVSEGLVVNHGDFLIRDSQSSPGDFVLTCHWEQNKLHFLIRKTVVQSSETCTRVQYSLEGEAFDSLPTLVHFYVSSWSTLTRCSGAQIHQPANRMLPISFLETAFCTTVTPQSHQRALKNGSKEEERLRPNSPSCLQHKRLNVSGERDGQSLTAAEESFISSPHNHTPPSRNPFDSRAVTVIPSPNLSKSSNASGALPSPSSSLHRQHLSVPQPPPDQDSPSCSGKGGSFHTMLHPQSFVERLQTEEGLPSIDPLRQEDVYFSPVVETSSCFKPSKYQSPLMAKENKPLEVSILRRVKELLAEIDPRMAAKHITKADCTVARILEVTPQMQRMMGVSSGMELLTLQHGQQLRLDLLERFQTMAIMLAVDVLGCTGTTEERAALLHKIIQIAAELKTTMGNMFGFAAVMRALELPQISRLEQTWAALRQRHTEGAILYEKTLRPFLKSLNDGKESCPLSSTTFPHVLPLLTLLEKSSAEGGGFEPCEMTDVGVDVVMFHLGAARTIAQLGGIYRSNCEGKLQGFQEQAEIREFFLTDFQMRLLWGSRGAEENQALRYSKFNQVLTALSNRLEPPTRRH